MFVKKIQIISSRLTKTDTVFTIFLFWALIYTLYRYLPLALPLVGIACPSSEYVQQVNNPLFNSIEQRFNLKEYRSQPMNNYRLIVAQAMRYNRVDNIKQIT